MPDKLRRKPETTRPNFKADRPEYEVGEDLGGEVEGFKTEAPPAGRTFGAKRERGTRTPGVPRKGPSPGES